MFVKEVHQKILEVGKFSKILEEILLLLLNETVDIRDDQKQQIALIQDTIKEHTTKLETNLEDKTNSLADIIKENKEDFKKDLDQFVLQSKNDNNERKNEINSIGAKLEEENQKRIDEGILMKQKLEKEKQELQAYLEKDTREMKAKIEADTSAIQQKLDREAQSIKQKISEENNMRQIEGKEMREKMDREKKLFKEKLDMDKKEMEERVKKEEDKQKALREKMKLENESKGSEITQMFDRLRNENDARINEIHGLKDVVNKEHEQRTEDIRALRSDVKEDYKKLNDAILDENAGCKSRLELMEQEIIKDMEQDKMIMKELMERDSLEIKRLMQLENDEIRQNMQVEKKSMINLIEEANDERRRETQLVRANVQHERNNMINQMETDARMLLEHLEKDSNDIINLLKREKMERERDSNMIKDRIANEKKELQILIDKDRENFSRKISEEHDMRRIEQMEMQQRLDANENAGQAEVSDLNHRLKREAEYRQLSLEECARTQAKDRSALEEMILRERQSMHESLSQESLDLNLRMDKANVDRMNDSADLQSKLAMLGKSASRHIEQLKNKVERDYQNIFELATKSCSIVFNAYREDSYADGGEEYVTFSDTSINYGNCMDPKSGEFCASEPGIYMFSLTLCTFDMKKCLVSLRKNGKDVASLFDQDGDENKGKTMISQNILLEIAIGDRVQVYAYTSTGITDHKNSHYTQFFGILLRNSNDFLQNYKSGNSSMNSSLENKKNGQDFEEDVSMDAGIRRGTPKRMSSKNNRRDRSATFSPPPSQTSTPLPKVSEFVNTKDSRDDGKLAGVIQNGNDGIINHDFSETTHVSKQQSYLALTNLGMGKQQLK